MNIDEIKARIRALLSRTVARGCTEAEAMEATKRALAMMREHGLSPEMVETSQAKADLSSARRAPIDRAWSAVAQVCRCVAWTERDGDGRRLCYLGRDPWPEIATWLHGIVQGAHDRAMKDFRASKAYQARRTSKTRATARRAFAEGFVEGIRRQLALMLQDENHDERKADLMLAEQGRDALNLQLSTPKPLAKAKDRRFDSARDAGWSSAASTQLRWGVQGQGEQLALKGPKA